MKNISFKLATGLLIFACLSGNGQGYHVKQIITGNSGKFEFSPPFEDFVTVQQFDPVTQSTYTFGTIFTQSLQDILIAAPFAYVSAQDSIVKFNLNTLERVAATADSGVNRLALCNGKLVISKQFPITSFFATIRDTSDLSLVNNIGGISGDGSGIFSTEDSVYIAVNGGWMGTDGKLAVVDPNTWTLVRQIDLGPEAVGIAGLYNYKDKIVSVNKTPYGIPDQGSLTVFDPASSSFQNHLYGMSIGNGCGIHDSLLYLLINNGIGSVNLNTMQVADSATIADPGSFQFIYITSAALDTINERLYVNIGDYVTPGYCLVTSLAGDSLTSYSTGISAEAIAVDYRENATGIDAGDANGKMVFTLYPNPATEYLHVQFCQPGFFRLAITDLTGRILAQRNVVATAGTAEQLDIRQLPAGVYVLAAESSDGRAVAWFIKR